MSGKIEDSGKYLILSGIYASAGLVLASLNNLFGMLASLAIASLWFCLYLYCEFGYSRKRAR